MPKMKTKKGAAKRFKQTGTGKFMYRRAGGRHLLTKKSSRRKRHLGQDGQAGPTERNRLRASLPYGL